MSHAPPTPSRPSTPRGSSARRRGSTNALLAPLLAALTLIPTHTWIRRGPVLSGSRVVWTSDGPAVYASAPLRRLWRGGGGDVTDLAASASRIAYIRRSDLWVGPPFHSSGAARSVDVDGKTVAYAQTVSGESRVRVGTATVATSRSVEYPHVAVAGHYVAWIELIDGKGRQVNRFTPSNAELHARRVVLGRVESPVVERGNPGDLLQG